MKNKALKILTLISCVHLIFSAIAGIFAYSQIPKFLLISDFQLVSLQFIPLSTSLLKLFLAVFVVLKVILSKHKILHKIASIPMAIAGIIQITLVIFYLSRILSYMSADIQINSLLTYLQLAELFFKIVFSLFVIFISIHTFKPFLRNKISLAISLGILSAWFVISVTIHIFLSSVISPTILISVLSYLITYSTLFVACYYGLRRSKLVYS